MVFISLTKHMIQAPSSYEKDRIGADGQILRFTDDIELIVKDNDPNLVLQHINYKNHNVAPVFHKAVHYCGQLRG